MYRLFTTVHRWLIVLFIHILCIQAENAGSDPDVFTLALLVLFGLAFLCASFIPFVVAEKESKVGITRLPEIHR